MVLIHFTENKKMCNTNPLKTGVNQNTFTKKIVRKVAMR